MAIPEDIEAGTNAYIKIMAFLTWKTVVKTVILALIALSFYVLFENRQTVYKGIIANNSSRTMIQAPVSAETKASIQALLNKPSGIMAVQLVSVDFRTNTRKTELFMTNNSKMEQEFEQYQSNSLGPAQFFTTDVVNNERNTELINGEFVCYPFKDLTVLQRVAHLSAYADTVCAVSIPPYPGYFSGYVVLYVKGVPTAEDTADIRVAARKLALSSYDLEISR